MCGPDPIPSHGARAAGRAPRVEILDRPMIRGQLGSTARSVLRLFVYWHHILILLVHIKVQARRAHTLHALPRVPGPPVRSATRTISRSWRASRDARTSGLQATRNRSRVSDHGRLYHRRGRAARWYAHRVPRRGRAGGDDHGGRHRERRPATRRQMRMGR